jgi:hypothetical protein
MWIRLWIDMRRLRAEVPDASEYSRSGGGGDEDENGKTGIVQLANLL